MESRLLSRRLIALAAPLIVLAAVVFMTPHRAAATDGDNLLVDGSFEQVMPKDQFGHVFKEWGGWKYDGDCEFRVGRVAHGGKTSCLLFGATQPKIRIAQTVKALPPGRYRVTAWLRGLEIGDGLWHQTTEFAVGDNYIALKKNGTFGWTPLTYVVELKEKKDVTVSFGLMAPGFFWIDDVSMVHAGNDEALTAEPVLGKEESPITPPGALADGAVRCPDCGFRNMPAWGKCYACGAELLTAQTSAGQAARVLTSFEDKSPFDGGQVVSEHATDGTKSLRLDKGYIAWSGPQDWAGYDYLKADVYADGDKPVTLDIEIADQQTKDYWTRVNYGTLLPPGKSTLVLPLAQLYVGEKARPGRNLLLSGITRLVFSVGDKPAGAIYLDNLRLERDTETAGMLFDGLYAFDLGPSTGPLMPGFTRIDPSTLYSKGRGYGLKDAAIWRAFDVLQPDPLYQDFICIEKGGLAVDVPNGRYHVFVNIDNPSGFWGEYQAYRHRSVLAQGKPVVEESMDFNSFKKKYFRYWDTEDLPSDNTFDKYQGGYFHEKQFDVDVTDGQLSLDFRGENWACSVSAVVIYPAQKAKQGGKFLDYVARKRRFFFDNYFHRILHKGTGDRLSPTAEDTKRGYVVFSRDYMEDVYYNDTPRKEEVGRPVTGFGFAGQYEPLTVSIRPLADLGHVAVTIGDLTGPGTIPSKDFALGYVTYRLTRVSADGTVYTIAPRLVLPRASVEAPKDVTRRFWLTAHTPADVKPGVYRGQITLTPEHGEPANVPVEYRVYPGTLDPVDVPAGPFSHTIDTPWPGDDPAAKEWDRTMEERSLRKLREYGFTSFTGMPVVRYLGFKDGQPRFDFTEGDRQMDLARRCGFTMPVVSYVGMPGLNLYFKDEAAMQAAGISDYSQFIKAVFSAIQTHADSAHWLPVYWNIGDEPVGDDVRRAAENAEAYKAAFPKGPPSFTAPTSLDSAKTDDPHFRFARALSAVSLNGHDEASVRKLQREGGNWGFYNGGNRWTYGIYMYKAAKQFDMKFRIAWHWNATAGDPYYALDCREDDYAWCNTNPDGELVPSLAFEREFRAGLDDYRCMLTLARLASEKHDAAAQELISSRLAAFKLGQREHDELFPVSDWREFRQQMADAIARLR
jgi:hypothetical protein